MDCPNGEDERYCTGVRNTNINDHVDDDGFQEVQQQEFGVWHTKCFPRNVSLTEQNITELCKMIGFENVTAATARVVVDSSDGEFLYFLHTSLKRICFNSVDFSAASTLRLTKNASDDTKAGADFIDVIDVSSPTVDGTSASASSLPVTISRTERQQPTKAILFNEFTPVMLNPRFKLFMKSNRPLMKVVPWDNGDKSNCFRLKIKCY